MQLFLRRFFIFLVPLGLVFVFPFLVFFFGREWYSLTTVEYVQDVHPEALFGLAYSNLGKPYKRLLVASRGPEIISLGTSRVLQFRKEFFSKPSTFYNAGSAITNIDDLRSYIKNLPHDGRLKFIILGLDQRMFRQDFLKQEGVNSNPQVDTISRFEDFVKNGWRKSYSDYFQGKFSFVELVMRSKKTSDIGLEALIDKTGFREDGSYRFGKAEDDLNHARTIFREIDNARNVIRKNRGGFEYDNSVSQTALEQLDDTLKFAKQRGITVVGFLPPYPSTLRDEILNVNDEYRATAIKLPSDVSRVFSNNNFDFYDFTNGQILEATQTEFANPSHGSDKIYLRMLIAMAENTYVLNDYVDREALKTLLKNSHGDFVTI